jgi:peptide/nickel transport system permease protein
MLFSFWLAKKAPGDPFKISYFSKEISKGKSASPKLEKKDLALFFCALESLDPNSKSLKWIPYLRFHGSENQFSKWTDKLFTGNFGKSFRYKVSVWKVLKKPIWISALIGILSTGLMIFFSISLAQYLSLTQNERVKKGIWYLLDLIYALPSYWLAILFLTFFASPVFLKIFPSGGIGGESSNFIFNLGDLLYHLILPIISLSIPPLAYYTKIIFQNINQESKKIYSLSAVARGYSPKRILKKELLRNSIIPLISHFPMFLSSLLGGALIIEKIFNLPGIGKLMVEAFTYRDYPIIFSIAFLTGIITLIGYLVTDILIMKYSPQIKASFEENP